jgi:hypothetical protein
MMITTLPTVVFGDKVCAVCGLTVAEYVNGREYLLGDGEKRYVHDGCWIRQIRGVTGTLYFLTNNHHFFHRRLTPTHFFSIMLGVFRLV